MCYVRIMTVQNILYFKGIALEKRRDYSILWLLYTIKIPQYRRIAVEKRGIF